MKQKQNKSTMTIQEKVKKVNEKIDYILQEYDCRLQIRMIPVNWFSKTFSKRIKIDAGIIILPNTQAPAQPINPPPVAKQ
jgi:hypothetical protein